jgi:hypothetical protein
MVRALSGWFGWFGWLVVLALVMRLLTDFVDCCFCTLCVFSGLGRAVGSVHKSETEKLGLALLLA